MEGYSKLAQMMGLDSELAIFRRFATLNLQNLLYLQAELVHLENELSRLVEVDRSSEHPRRRYYSQDWWSLSNSSDDGDDKQWQKVLKIRTLLKEYSTALHYPTLYTYPTVREG